METKDRIIKGIITDIDIIAKKYDEIDRLFRDKLIEFNEENDTEYEIAYNGLEIGIFVGGFPYPDHVSKLLEFVKNNGFKRCSWYGQSIGNGGQLWLILKDPDGFEWDHFGRYYIIEE